MKRRRQSTAAPKRGNGTYWGYKWDAKKESNRLRRENAKRELRNELTRDTAKTTRTLIDHGVDDSGDTLHCVQG
jgi:hypothetical protein